MPGRRKKRISSRSARLRGPIRLGLVFLLLVGINVYVFLIRPGNVSDLKEKVAQARLPEPEPTPAPAPVAEADDGPTAGELIERKVLKGDSLARLLKREGIPKADADEVISALEAAQLDPRTIRQDQTYTIQYDDDGRLHSFELRTSPVVVYRAERDADGKLSGRRLEAKTETRVFEIAGVVQTSLYDAVKARGERTELVATFVDMFAYDINFFVDTHPGDRFGVIIEKIYLGNEFYKYGAVLAAEYHTREGTFRAFRWQVPGAVEPSYYDERGQNITKSMLKTPLKYGRVSSGFNPRRMHPVLHRVKGHWGTDYAAPVGTPVQASADATVVSAARAGGAGNMVVLRHGNGLETYYMHLSKFAKGLKAGQKVRQKQVIGYVGTTGLSTGPHLHFGVKQGGRWVDAQTLKINRGAPVPAKHLEEFRAATAPRVAVLLRLNPPTAGVTATR